MLTLHNRDTGVLPTISLSCLRAGELPGFPRNWFVQGCPESGDNNQTFHMLYTTSTNSNHMLIHVHLLRLKSKGKKTI
ncbi:hypothetical protein Hanom_Chr16g01495761 [Helianthus anomalus]